MQQQSQIKCELSVFLALIIVLVASLLLSVTELYREKAQKTYLTLSANSAMDSLFSQYHLELWDNYRLLGLEMYSGDEIRKEYYGFLAPYFDSDRVFNWYGSRVTEDGISVGEYTLLTDGNGSAFEKNVEAYILFGAPGLLKEEGSLEAEMSAVEEGEKFAEEAAEMQQYSKDALKLQEKMDDLEKEVSEAEEARKDLLKEAEHYDASGIRQGISSCEDCFTDAYQKAEKAETSILDLEAEVKETASFSSENEAARQYLDSLKSREQELERLKEDIQENKEKLTEIGEAADRAEEEISSFVPGEILVGYEKPAKEGDPMIPIYEEETLDEAGVWQETISLCDGLKHLSFDSGTGTVDEEKKNAFEEISSFLEGSVMDLVYPEGGSLSKETIEFGEKPSERYLEKGDLLAEIDVAAKGAVMAYANLKLSDLNPGEEETGAPELEYVLEGKDSDRENVAAVATELVAVRTGANLTYLLSSAKSVSEATQLAVSISGAAAGSPLVVLVTFLVLSVWATGQAVLDVRKLMTGGKVPLIHTKKTFTLTKDGLLNSFKKELKEIGKRDEETKKKEQGLTYDGYLNAMLLFRSLPQTDYRIMDVIQKNMRKVQEDFRMDRLYTSLTVSVEGTTGHVFYGGTKAYRTGVSTYYSY